MRRTKRVEWFLFLFLCVCLSSCAKRHYVVSNIEVSRMKMDSVWDTKADSQFVALVNTYKTGLEREMSAVIGTTAETLVKGFPQSLLSNLTADALKAEAEKSGETVDFAVINNGGLRSTLNKGTITVGNLYEIYSFDNTLVILELQGKSVRDFFDFIAEKGGEGLSSGIQLIAKKGKVVSLKIGGLPLDENKVYRIATLDYLAEGNDGMIAFKKAIRKFNSNKTLRDIMIDYVKDCTKNNKEINAKLDDRIIIDL